MNITNGAEDIDYRRAIALVKYTAPTAFDADGVNAILGELDADGRITQFVMALAGILHNRAPHLGTPDGLRALQDMAEQLRIKEMIGEQE